MTINKKNLQRVLYQLQKIMIKQIQFNNEQTEDVRSFFNNTDFDFMIISRLNLNKNGYLLTIDGTEENIKKLINLLEENNINF
jgi:hypothetical protein